MKTQAMKTHRRALEPFLPVRRRALMSGLATSLILSAAWSGCSGGDDDDASMGEASPSPEVWSTPEFSGDGLPPSAGTEHESNDTGAQTPSTPGGDDDETSAPEPEFVLVDGAFGWSTQNGSYSGRVILMEATFTCHNLFSALDNAKPDGLYFTLSPVTDTSGPVWPQHYPVCGDNPCSRGYSLVGGESTDLDADSWINIDSYDAHYLTVSWSSTVSEGAGLTFYNCGNTENWAY